MGDATVDTGATASVVGADWLHEYIEAVSSYLRADAVERPEAVIFRFGDRRTTLADKHWMIPMCLEETVRQFGTRVIPGSLPLFLSRSPRRVARPVLDFEDDTLWLKEEPVTSSPDVGAAGHLSLNMLPPPTVSSLAVSASSRSRRVSFALPADIAPPAANPPAPTAAVGVPGPRNPETAPFVPAVALGASDVDLAVDGEVPPSARPGEMPVAPPTGVVTAVPADPARLRSRDSLAVVSAELQLMAVLTGLHRQSAHPDCHLLDVLLKRARCTDAAIVPALRRDMAACARCRSSRQRSPRTVLTMPRVTLFNDTVAVDLAEMAKKGRFLHMSDLGSRHSRCVVVPDKDAPTTFARFCQSRSACTAPCASFSPTRAGNSTTRSSASWASGSTSVWTVRRRSRCGATACASATTV